ncbi:MFS transporter [Rhodococcus chondri]|uniref:MFS transporter n=1 Tax=Rhodococcus chondri TaxID=3065941 RepID=A0ABU7JVW6_9NOCA|nr:MFS transporter [Rhodococcus sp. CC-R104]MEE2033674.1 MFS transporter [Rhodococcus sp. CC-R104]
MTTRTQRLDELPFTGKHRRLLAGSGVGWALDAMDVGLISFVMAALAVQWELSPTQLSWIGSIGFVGMAIGASVGGLLADRIGRRQVFAITLLVYGLATGAAALSVSVAMLIALRFVVGLGLGAELPVASTLVSEFAPRKIRGRVVVALEAFWAVGWLLAALIGYFVVPLNDDGWRWALAVGIVPAAYALVVRFGLPESVRFLESKGRHAEAEAIVRDYERSAGTAPANESQAVESPGSVEPVAPAEPAQRVSIWAPHLRARTAALWIVWFGINLSYYGAFIWLPSLLVAQGFDLVTSFGYTLIITLAQLPGYGAAAWLIEVWGRRVTLAAFLTGSAIAAALFGLAETPATIIAAGMALSFFNLGAWGALYAIGPELYPTAVRGSGTGAAAAFGRLASILAPLLVPLLLDSGGSGLVFGVFAAAFVVAAVAAFTLPERAGTVLE